MIHLIPVIAGHIEHIIAKHQNRKIDTVQDMAQAMVDSFKKAAKDSDLKLYKVDTSDYTRIMHQLDTDFLDTQNNIKKELANRDAVKDHCAKSHNVYQFPTWNEPQPILENEKGGIVRGSPLISITNITFKGRGERKLTGTFEISACERYNRFTGSQIILQSSFQYYTAIGELVTADFPERPVAFGKPRQDVMFSNTLKYSQYLRTIS